MIDYYNIIVTLYEEKLYFEDEKEFLVCLTEYYKKSINWINNIKDINIDIILREKIYLCIDSTIRKILYLENILD
jgi:hypothetical protein